MEKIKELIDELYDEILDPDLDVLGYKDWCYDFAAFLKGRNFSEQEIEDIIRTMLDERNLYNVDNIEYFEGNGGTIVEDDWSPENRKSFFEYLESISSETTRQYVLDGIEFAKKDLHINNNFIDAFIKYIVITNFKDLSVESRIPELKAGTVEYASLFCKLGEFVLADLEVYKTEDFIGNKNIRFDDVSTRINLRSMKLGALLFRKLQGDVAHYFPGYNLYANTVDKENNSARRFYKSIGAEVIEVESEEVEDMEHEYYPYFCEYDADCYCIALFPADRLRELSEIPVEPPTLEYYTNLQAKQSTAIAIREYINGIMQMQKQYQAEGKEIPIFLKMPEQIEVSPSNLEYLFVNDVIRYKKIDGELRIIWKRTEKYPELELRMKQNDKGKYALTYIKGRMMEGEDVFIWDSKEKEGKKGILVISRDDDALEDLVPMDNCDDER